MFNSKLKARIAELELELERNNVKRLALSRVITGLEAKIDRLESAAERPKRKVHRLVNIKFRALFNGLYQPTEFKTGPGPCGHCVAHFTLGNTEKDIVIRQHHADGSRKDFVYRKSDIDGRVQYSFDVVDGEPIPPWKPASAAFERLVNSIEY